jgi:hypothetical protein
LIIAFNGIKVSQWQKNYFWAAIKAATNTGEKVFVFYMPPHSHKKGGLNDQTIIVEDLQT